MPWPKKKKDVHSTFRGDQIYHVGRTGVISKHHKNTKCILCKSANFNNPGNFFDASDFADVRKKAGPRKSWWSDTTWD